MNIGTKTAGLAKAARGIIGEPLITQVESNSACVIFIYKLFKSISSLAGALKQYKRSDN